MTIEKLAAKYLSQISMLDEHIKLCQAAMDNIRNVDRDYLQNEFWIEWRTGQKLSETKRQIYLQFVKDLEDLD
jgi:hypothetical protein